MKMKTLTIRIDDVEAEVLALAAATSGKTLAAVGREALILHLFPHVAVFESAAIIAEIEELDARRAELIEALEEGIKGHQARLDDLRATPIPAPVPEPEPGQKRLRLRRFSA